SRAPGVDRRCGHGNGVHDLSRHVATAGGAGEGVPTGRGRGRAAGAHGETGERLVRETVRGRRPLSNRISPRRRGGAGARGGGKILRASGQSKWRIAAGENGEENRTDRA